MIDNSVEQEVVPTVPDLNSFRVISERGGSRERFSARENFFGGEFTHERARQAFEDYKSLRDQLDKANRRKDLQRKLELARNGNRKAIEVEIRRNEFSYYPQGGEVIFVCADFEEAEARVMELIGPVKPADRHDRYCRLGESKAIHDQGKNGPYNGFEAVCQFETRGKLHKFSRSWRIDYDEKKGPHFNVIVRPSQIVSGSATLDKSDPESLNIAIVFPGNIDTYKKHLNTIEMYAITSLVNGDTAGHSLDYLTVAGGIK